MHTFSISGKTIALFPSSEPGAPVICLNTFSGEGQKIFSAAQNAGCSPFTLVAISNLDWNHDMAPWNSPPVFPKASPCTGGADDYLQLLTRTILPTAEKELSQTPCWRGIVGYSLAGLFALYALYQTDLFSRAGSISGSLWFPGIKEYVCTHAFKRKPDCIYFSLGDREHKTRNPVLSTVQRRTVEIQAYCQAVGVDTVFEQNPGNHYSHAAERTAAGLCWLLRR